MTLLLVVLVAVVAALCAYIFSAAIPKSRRRARGHFVLGFCCGVATGALVRRRMLRTFRSASGTTGLVDVLRLDRRRRPVRRRTYASARAILGRQLDWRANRPGAAEVRFPFDSGGFGGGNPYEAMLEP